MERYEFTSKTHKNRFFGAVFFLLQFQAIPKYASQVVSRFIKPLSQPYHDLATAFAMDNNSSLNTIVNKHSDVYTRDHNMGLVKQVASVLYKKNIQRLTKTFLTLSLTDVASRVGLPTPADAEKYILHMVTGFNFHAFCPNSMELFAD